jgi:hypothetical protein
MKEKISSCNHDRDRQGANGKCHVWPTATCVAIQKFENTVDALNRTYGYCINPLGMGGAQWTAWWSGAEEGSGASPSAAERVCAWRKNNGRTNGSQSSCAVSQTTHTFFAISS